MEKADGTFYTWSLRVLYDGKEYPVTTTDQKGRAVPGLYKTASAKQVDANTFEWTKVGPSIRTVRLVLISEDGRTMTCTDKRETPDGKVLSLRYVYTKQ